MKKCSFGITGGWCVEHQQSAEACVRLLEDVVTKLGQDLARAGRQEQFVVDYAKQRVSTEDAVRVVVEGFIGTVDALLRHVETRGRGGQQVPFHGDFAEAQPSTVSRLRWWKKRMEEALGRK